jgi:hemoglobin
MPINTTLKSLQFKSSTTTLFDKYGGVSMVVKVVKDFQYEILHRPHLAKYFQGLDLDTISQHSILYLSYALGKPAKVYTSRELHHSHSKFQISGLHYDEFADVLKDALITEGFNNIDIKSVMRHLEKVRYIFFSE